MITDTLAHLQPRKSHSSALIALESRFTERLERGVLTAGPASESATAFFPINGQIALGYLRLGYRGTYLPECSARRSNPRSNADQMVSHMRQTAKVSPAVK